MIPTIYGSLASIHIYILFKIKQLEIHIDIYLYIWPSRIHNIYRSRRHSKIQTSVEKFARSICDLFDHPSSIISICRHNICCPIKPAILYTSYRSRFLEVIINYVPTLCLFLFELRYKFNLVCPDYIFLLTLRLPYICILQA